jgi:hypothetical protein
MTIQTGPGGSGAPGPVVARAASGALCAGVRRTDRAGVTDGVWRRGFRAAERGGAMSKASDQARRLEAGVAAASAARELVSAPRRRDATPLGENPATERPPRVRNVRHTVDLSPVEHRQFAVWCAEAAGELGVARVTGQEVLRALVVELLADDELARRIREVI